MRIFDVCGTLYDSNTTFDFIIEYHKYRNNRFKRFWTWMLLSFPFKVLNKFKLISIRKSMIATLKGEKKLHLDSFSKDFVSEFLINKEKKIPMQLLGSGKINSLLISASIDPVINAIADQLSVKAYSSVLEYNEHSQCTGRLSLDLKGIKSGRIDIKNLEFVVTDNMSDIDLIKLSNLSYIVTNKNNKNKWLFLMSQNCIDLEKVYFL